MTAKKTWLPLESDPDSLSAFLHKLGQPKLKFADVLGFQEDVLALTPKPVHALLLLYPLCDQKKPEALEEETYITEHKNVWFIKQTIPNACGTIALLHLLGNLKEKFPLDKDSIADLFFKKVQGMNPEEKAKELEENEIIQALHQSFAESGVTDVGNVSNVDTHFIVFLEIDGHLFELDGRNNKPVAHGITTAETFLEDAAKIIENNYIAKVSNENRFSALALVPQSTT